MPVADRAPRYHVCLIIVAVNGAVSARATQRGGACHGWDWNIRSYLTLAEFLASHNHEIPAGTPVVRFDHTDDTTRQQFTRHVEETFAGQPVPSDEYAALAEDAGVTTERTPHVTTT